MTATVRDRPRRRSQRQMFPGGLPDSAGRRSGVHTQKGRTLIAVGDLQAAIVTEQYEVGENPGISFCEFECSRPN